jgi:hypothetical protein
MEIGEFACARPPKEHLGKELRDSISRGSNCVAKRLQKSAKTEEKVGFQAEGVNP